MNGTTKSSEVSLATTPPDWQIVGTGDFNSDSQTDIIWQNTASGERKIWIMNGTSKSSEVALGTIDTAWRIVGAGDMGAHRNYGTRRLADG